MPFENITYCFSCTKKHTVQVYILESLKPFCPPNPLGRLAKPLIGMLVICG